MICNNMMCDNELQGKQTTFCSDRCRKQVSRRNKAPEDAPRSTNSDTTIPQHVGQTNSDANSDSQPEHVFGRDCACDQCQANHVDAELTDDKIIEGMIEADQIDKAEHVKALMDDVEDRTEQPTAESLTRQQLNSKIRAYPNDTWINSLEHNELVRRLKGMEH